MKNPNNGKLVELASGEIYLWVEQESSIHIKAVTSYGDPVELAAHQAKELVAALNKMIELLEGQ